MTVRPHAGRARTSLYVDMQRLDLEGDDERKIFLGVITPLVMGLCAVVQPLLVTPWLLRRALRSEGELRVQRLSRIPALLAFGETMVSWFASGILFNGGVVLLWTGRRR